MSKFTVNSRQKLPRSPTIFAKVSKCPADGHFIAKSIRISYTLYTFILYIAYFRTVIK